ncbi:MAG: exodeoxyribonuclease VII large subunit [Planctomycetes bacterium]|nr:exodeoxyribonuclease VII large subunit [Planctomycetota bacterium]
MVAKNAKIYSVSQINSLIRVALEETLPSTLQVTGEISDFRHHQSGHCYFLLKDESGVLPCVMWAGSFKKVKFAPENGMAVLAKGHIDVYPAGGKYQLYVNKLEPAGVGALQLAFEQMVKRLQKEGLFKDEHKKPIPPYPMRIAILTSRSGAAVADIADSIYNRWPCAKLLLYHVPVQGEGAAEKIAAAINDINRRNKQLQLDVLIAGRGGGSQEDLWAFNEEPLARAIYASNIPVISAVGHEIDTTIADLVADARASTPTKAGMIAVPDMNEVLERVSQAQMRLNLNASQKLALATQHLQTIRASAVFKTPRRILSNPAQQVDELALSLADSARNIFTSLNRRLDNAFAKVLQIEPHRLIGAKRLHLNNLTNTSQQRIKSILAKKQLQLTAVANKLTAMDPKAVLSRGYSITTNKKTGKIVTAAKDVKNGDTIITELAKKNKIESKVQQTDPSQPTEN